jgi:hypothetical protein
MIKTNFIDFFLGIYDSLQIFNIYDIVSSPKIYKNLVTCVQLNLFVCIGSLMIYKNLIEPIINYILSLTSLGYFLYIIVLTFYIFYILLFIICQLLTTFQTDEIYYATLELVDENKDQRIEIDSLSSLSNILQRLLIVISFSVSLKILDLVPLLKPLQWALMCVLNSLYVFEYILLQKYVKDYKRILNFIENRLFYFLGYGMLMTIMVTYVQEYTFFIFLMAYPFFMIASVKVYNRRFRNEDNIPTQLRFLYFIEKFYEIGLLMIQKLINRRVKNCYS